MLYLKTSKPHKGTYHAIRGKQYLLIFPKLYIDLISIMIYNFNNAALLNRGIKTSPYHNSLLKPECISFILVHL